MIGNLLLRKSIQVLKKELKGPIPWDTEIVGSLADEWLLYFSQLVTLKSVKFPRSFKPIGVDQSEKPDLITFSDGNPDSFGTNAYVRWLMQDGSYEVRLLMSKAKLCAILQKGETVKSELNGATLQARLTVWIKKHSGVEFKNHYPFVDSRIVQSMLQKTIYGFSTFVGLRVGEIQQKTDRSSWLHIASSENIADILTRGASPDKLGPGSVWQCVLPLVTNLHPSITVLTILAKTSLEEATIVDPSLQFILPKSSLVVAYKRLPNLQFYFVKMTRTHSLLDRQILLAVKVIQTQAVNVKFVKCLHLENMRCPLLCLVLL